MDLSPKRKKIIITPASTRDPWVGVHTLTEFMFCPRAGILSSETKEIEEDVFEHKGSDYLPDYNLRAISMALKTKLEELEELLDNLKCLDSKKEVLDQREKTLSNRYKKKISTILNLALSMPFLAIYLLLIVATSLCFFVIVCFYLWALFSIFWDVSSGLNSLITATTDLYYFLTQNFVLASIIYFFSLSLFSYCTIDYDLKVTNPELYEIQSQNEKNIDCLKEKIETLRESIRILYSRRKLAIEASAIEPDPETTNNEVVNWWNLLAAGFDSMSCQEPLSDEYTRTVGRPWRILQKGSFRIPVWKIKMRSNNAITFKLRAQHYARMAAYCNLVEQSIGGKSPYGIILFSGDQYVGITVSNSENNGARARGALSRGLKIARKSIQEKNKFSLGEPELTSKCVQCPFGKPFVKNHYVHSECGDRFDWTPPHQNTKHLTYEMEVRREEYWIREQKRMGCVIDRYGDLRDEDGNLVEYED